MVLRSTARSTLRSARGTASGPPSPGPASPRRWAGWLVPLLVIPLPPAWCQVAEVVAPDAQGNFPAITLPGPRGPYPQRFWLVVDRDPRGLWCRDSRGRPLVALRRGAVLETDATANPVLLRDGRPYLRVRPKPVAIQEETRLRDRGTALSCWVRAHGAFVAPIHPDSLEAVLAR